MPHSRTNPNLTPIIKLLLFTYIRNKKRSFGARGQIKVPKVPRPPSTLHPLQDRLSCSSVCLVEKSWRPLTVVLFFPLFKSPRDPPVHPHRSGRENAHSYNISTGQLFRGPSGPSTTAYLELLSVGVGRDLVHSHVSSFQRYPQVLVHVSDVSPPPPTKLGPVNVDLTTPVPSGKRIFSGPCRGVSGQVLRRVRSGRRRLWTLLGLLRHTGLGSRGRGPMSIDESPRTPTKNVPRRVLLRSY